VLTQITWICYHLDRGWDTFLSLANPVGQAENTVSKRQSWVKSCDYSHIQQASSASQQ
jgi:hypothetical protein